MLRNNQQGERLVLRADDWGSGSKGLAHGERNNKSGSEGRKTLIPCDRQSSCEENNLIW